MPVEINGGTVTVQKYLLPYQPPLLFHKYGEQTRIPWWQLTRYCTSKSLFNGMVMYLQFHSTSSLFTLKCTFAYLISAEFNFHSADSFNKLATCINAART
jgi:hypothetical protein